MDQTPRHYPTAPLPLQPGWRRSVFTLFLLFALPRLPLAQTEPAPRTQPTGDSVSRGLNFANALLSERRYELAAEEYERVLAQAPSNQQAAEATYGLARARLFLRNYAEARRLLERFLAIAPTNPDAPAARFRLAEAALLLGDQIAAAQLLRDYLDQHPTHTHADSAWSYLGDIRYAQNQLDNARTAYEKSLSIAPNGPSSERTQFFLARTLADLGEVDLAINQLRALTPKTPSPWADRAQLQIGLVQLAANRFEDALGTFSQLQLSPPPSITRPELNIRRAEALIGLNRLPEAEALLKSVYTDKSTSPFIAAQAGYALGSLLWDREKVNEALQVWEASLALGPSDALAPMLLFRSAEALARLGRTDQAQTQFIRLAETYPNDLWADRALIQAARLALDARNFSLAKSLASSLVEKYPNSPLCIDARFTRARALQLANELDPAITEFKAIAANPDTHPETRHTTLYYLSLAQRSLGQDDQAAQTLGELAKLPDSPLAASAKITLAQDHYEAQRFEAAIPLLEQYLSSPHAELASHALALLTLAHHQTGNQVAAEQSLDRLARDWPESEDLARVRVRLGEEALHANDHPKAIALLKPAADSPASTWSARARSALGWAYLGNQQPSEAALAFASVAAADSSQELRPEADLMRAWSLEQANDHPAAIEAYTETISNHPNTSQSTAATLARARLLSRMGQFNKAAAEFDAFLRAHPNGGPDENASPDRILFEAARAHEQAGHSDSANQAYQRLIKSHPNSTWAAEAHIQLADSAVRSQRLDDAARWLEPLTQLNPDQHPNPTLPHRALFKAGRIALDRGEYPLCISLLSRLIDLNPPSNTRDQAQFWRAEAFLRNNDPKSAEAEFARLADSPGTTPQQSWRSTAKLRQIQALLALKRWADVLTLADRLIADQPDFPHIAELHFARGRALQSQALPRFQDARLAYQNAIDAQPGSEIAARAQFMRGETFLFEKNHREALREFHQVELLYKAPTWQAAALFESGKAYEALNQPGQAITSYAKLIDSFPDDSHAEEARRRLNTLQPARTSTTP